MLKSLREIEKEAKWVREKEIYDLKEGKQRSSILECIPKGEVWVLGGVEGHRGVFGVH